MSDDGLYCAVSEAVPPKAKRVTLHGKLSLMMVIITRERTARADQELARMDASIIGKLPGRLLCTLPSLITIEPLVKQKTQHTDLQINCVWTSCTE